MQCISVKVCIPIHDSIARALVEESFDAEVVDSSLMNVRTATTSDIEPSRLS